MSRSTAIFIAVIGLIGGVLAAATPGIMERINPPKHREVQDPALHASRSDVAPTARVRLIAARIGRIGVSGEVEKHTTRVGPHDEIAITLHVAADQSVANIPVRINGTVFGGLHMYQVKDSTDVSEPGERPITLRFRPIDTFSEPLFLTLEIEGRQVYSEEISIADNF